MATILSLELFKAWGDKERSEFVSLCQDSINNCPEAMLQLATEPGNINFILYELCNFCMQGHLSSETVVLALNEILPLHDELPSLIADILAILDTESLCQEQVGNVISRDRFYSLLRLCNIKVVPEFVLKERLDFETLGGAGIMKSLRNITTKFVKTKTRLFYKQQKYNLYREEIEGFAKLITELVPKAEGESNVNSVLEVLQSLIGCFNLDPNRVLDVILESFECNPKYSNFFIQLLRMYFGSSETISQIIGFKFGFYQQGDVKETPATLYRVTAFLLKSKVMNLSQIYSLLTPDDSKIAEDRQQEFVNAQAYVKQLNSLATNPENTNKDIVKIEATKVEDIENQKLGLLAALIDIGDWEHAKQLMGCFPDFYALSHTFIAKRLCVLCHVLIDDFYRKFTFIPRIKPPSPWKLESGVKVKSIDNFTELFGTVYEIVYSLGPYLHVDPVLMAKIIRLSRSWIGSKSCVPEFGLAVISNIVDQSLLPSLSLLECNCCMAEDLWSLLKLFPYQTRYSFYSNWKTASNQSHPLLFKLKADVQKKLKYIMKRLSKETVKPSGRQIGKLSHSNPGYIFDYILSQIQTWDNLIVPVIDSLKYLTSLSYDVLAFCVIEALGNSEKDRMKTDGTSISLWFQSLANFGGAVFKKYPVDISGLLQHVANQLIAGKSLDLLILKEIVQKMAGIEAAEEMTPDQLDAMTGGELLRSEGGYFNQLRNVKKSSQRLKESLLDHDLAIPLCLLMAQQKNCILFQEHEHSHIKLVGKLYDQCQDALVQYGSFLANNLSIEDYAKRLPSVSALMTEYSIQTDVAFYLARPSLNHLINSKFEEARKHDKTLKTAGSGPLIKKYLEVVELVISPIVQSVKSNQVHKKAWDDLNPQFFITFWSLSMYDLVVPSGSYEREVNKLKAMLQSEELKDVGKKKKERERCDAVIAKLTEEEKMQQVHCGRIMARLKNEKDDWFHSRAAKNETITQFLQLCLFPRCIFSPVDALYCAKFVHLIHCLKTPNFSTLLCYDRVFCDITNTVASCTENEASRYGLLLCSMLKTVMRWHSDKEIFDKECASFPGFMTKFKVADKTGENSVDHVDYENYRHVCHKWHFKITKSLLNCLDSGDYVQIRNSLLVLLKIAPHFPIVQSLGLALERRIEKIKVEEKEKRPDLYVLATGYSGILKSKKPALIPESEFHLREPRHQVKKETPEQAKVTSSSDQVASSRRSKSGSSERVTVTANVKRSTREVEQQNGDLVNNNRSSKTSRSKEVETSPGRRSKEERREKSISEDDAAREHKRRRIDGQRSPREASQADERNGKIREATPPEKSKSKEKSAKANRKREYSDDSPSEQVSRRRRPKDDDGDRVRREEVVVEVERRVVREEKKHHRSSSASSGVKKRS